MISVIVPVYNAGRYLARCLSSIIAQTYRDIEIVLVNDCSTDSSLDICLRFKKQDKRVILIDKSKNEGVDKARFSGLNSSRGEYVVFVDSDDWLPVDSLECMYGLMNKYGCDVVKGGCQRYMRSFRFGNSTNVPEYVGHVISHDEFMDKYYVGLLGYNNFPANIWGTLYRRAIIAMASISPCGASFGEDLVFNLKVLPHASKIYCTNHIVYNYRVEVGQKWKYGKEWLKNARMLYNIKSECQSKYKVRFDGFYIQVEMVNMLKTFVDRMMDVKNVRYEDILECVREELKHEEYKGCSILVGTHYAGQAWLKAILSQDAEGFCKLMHEMRKSYSLKDKVKRLIRRIL